MDYILLFLLIVAVVAFTMGLIKPVPLRASLREGLIMFLTTGAGMGLAALLVHFLSR